MVLFMKNVDSSCYRALKTQTLSVTVQRPNLQQVFVLFFLEASVIVKRLFRRLHLLSLIQGSVFYIRKTSILRQQRGIIIEMEFLKMFLTLWSN